jgi:outer membrane autotransporter protein
VRYNDILDHATSCEVPSLAGSVLECRTSPTHVWGQVDFQNRRTDGDGELGGYDSDRWTAVLGVDFNVGGAAIVGASIGRVTNRVDFNRTQGEFKADGYQLGAYGVFDPGAFYVKALGTYNWFDGDAEREVDFTPFGGTFEGTIGGDPDVRMWTLGLHGGARFAVGASSVVTPYLNLDHTNTKLKGFEETGLSGANLTVYNSTLKRTTLTAGVKFAGEFGGVVPELNLGYRHQFGDRRADFRAAFLGDEDCSFDIVSQDEKRGALLAGLTVGGRAGPLDIRVGYQGVYNGDAKSHAGNFRIILPFGGAPAPVAAPAYVAPPPPPPPPAPVYEQPAPPPPPPPAPSGERGE